MLRKQSDSDRQGSDDHRARKDQEENEDRNSGDLTVSNKKIRGTGSFEGGEETKGKDGGQEATSPGAAGQLTGASVRACQEP